LQHCKKENACNPPFKLKKNTVCSRFSRADQRDESCREEVKEGKVKSLTAKEAGYAIQLSNYSFLDVRPSTEHSKVYVKDSIWIPIYDVDKSLDPGTLLKKLSNFSMGT
jgi:hypothetical protein